VSGDGILEEGAATSSPARWSAGGSAVSSPSGARDGAPTAQRFSTIFSTQNGLSWRYNIANHAAILRAKTPVGPLAYTPELLVSRESIRSLYVKECGHN